MSKWVKNAVMLTVLGIWSVYMLTYLIRGILPDPALWGVPGGVWFILNPPAFTKRLGKTQENEE